MFKNNFHLLECLLLFEVRSHMIHIALYLKYYQLLIEFQSRKWGKNSFWRLSLASFCDSFTSFSSKCFLLTRSTFSGNIPTWKSNNCNRSFYCSLGYWHSMSNLWFEIVVVKILCELALNLALWRSLYLLF